MTTVGRTGFFLSEYTRFRLLLSFDPLRLLFFWGRTSVTNAVILSRRIFSRDEIWKSNLLRLFYGTNTLVKPNLKSNKR